MRQMLGLITFVVMLAATACGGDDEADRVATDSEAADTTSSVVQGADEAPLCTELFAPGQTTDEVLTAVGMDTTENMQTGGECIAEDGDVAIQIFAYNTCPSGARVWHNSYGYGVAGGTWTAFPEGTSTPPADC
jgi:hypothetical protein